jgi:hypothetical protein
MAAFVVPTIQDITEEVEVFLNETISPSDKKTKLLQAMRTVREKELQIHYIFQDNANVRNRRQTIITDNIGQEVAHFDVNLINGAVDKYSLGISTEEIGDQHTGQGFARLLIASMICKLEQEGVSNQATFYIDTDASGGFWDHVGMKRNPRYEPHAPTHNPHHPENGYEKEITVGNISKFAINRVTSNYGGRKSKKRHVRKSKKRKYRR